MESGEKSVCDEQEEGEILFVEDRRPGNVSPVRFDTRDSISRVKPPSNNEWQDFICLDSTGENVDKEDDESSDDDTDSVNSHKSTEQSVEDMLRVIEDRNPQLTGQQTQSPRYKISDNFLKPAEESKEAKRKFSNTCWNCNETSHALRDCPHPRDRVEINRNRMEFQTSRGPQTVYKRYHVEESQRFAHLVPGELSDELRRAMGLEGNQLPTHVYMMRQLGYPPGWLKEALVSHSGISMFDGQGQEIANPGTEAGEVVEEGSLDKYDGRRIIRYPGFNVPPPPGTYDDSAYWRCPPLSKWQSVDVMLDRLKGRVVGGYKRKKLAHPATVTSDPEDTSQSAESLDMEYEETPVSSELPEDNCKFVPPLPDVELPPPPPLEVPPPPPPPSETPPEPGVSLICPEVKVEDTSLIALEEEKKRILAQLNDTSPLCGTPESRVGKVKSVDLGTPILKSVSPFARLPTSDKFSINICDVINFENLPDSTGKYEKISGIIKNVRSRLSLMNDEL